MPNNTALYAAGGILPYSSLRNSRSGVQERTSRAERRLFFSITAGTGRPPKVLCCGSSF